ncbi:MAG TPA: DUF1016 family protein [Nitrospirae bacterium]|nr:hypothetical protein BMS3Abin06_01144 [bacterium BMS3Abin06]HDH11152.1 DUF1016 family protein [Nitrospirota bacterium]HDZ02631.1 DUF1016 family protein [Nitrospirota bacterium]
MTTPRNISQLHKEVRTYIESARTAAVRAVNTTMVHTYFHIGMLIVNHEQKGAKRAEYAKETLKSLSQKLTAEFGRGFSVDNLELMRRFYLVYSKSETLSRKSPAIFQLSWSHYVFLMKRPEAAEAG